MPPEGEVIVMPGAAVGEGEGDVEGEGETFGECAGIGVERTGVGEGLAGLVGTEFGGGVGEEVAEGAGLVTGVVATLFEHAGSAARAINTSIMVTRE